MATDLGNPAFRMALRMLLVSELLGAVPSDLPGSYAARGRHIFLSQNTSIKTLNFLNKVCSFDVSTS